MDNLTHSLAGLFLARAGLKHATPRGTAIMVLAANSPDVDAVSWLSGTASYIHWHRNITHSLAAIPIMALLSVAVIRVCGRKQIRWVPAFLIALVAVVSHIVLDLTNVYGVRLLLPFSGKWFHWDLTPVVDLTIWAMLLIGIIAPWLSGLVSSEIGERRSSSGGGAAVAALLLVSAYDSARGFLHDRAAALMDAHIYNGLAARRTGAFPDGNPLVWTGIAELSNAYVEIPVDLRRSFRADSGLTFYKAERNAAIEASMQTEPFQRFLEFVQYPLWTSEPAPDVKDATRVRLVDLRFGTPEAPGLASWAIVRAGFVTDAGLGFGGPPAH